MALSNASELGLLGIALWAAIMIGAIVLPARRRLTPAFEPWRLGLIAVAVAWFIQSNFTPLDYAFDNYIVWLWAGIVAIGARMTYERAPDDVSEPDAVPLPASRSRRREAPVPVGT
jgi:O-antigen ligase